MLAMTHEKSDLRALISSACPRTHIGLTDYTQGSLEVVFADNLHRTNIQAFASQLDGLDFGFYSQIQNPSIFSSKEGYRVADKAEYAVVKHRDSDGKIWTIEAFHPKFQEQDIGINQTTGNRTDRFIYTYDEVHHDVYLSKVNISLRGDQKDRFQHDTVSMRVSRDGAVQTRVRLNQRTSFKLDSAKETREKSPQYGHIDAFDASHVLGTYVDIDTKIVVGDFEDAHAEKDRFEDYVSTYERVEKYYEIPSGMSFNSGIEQVIPNHKNVAIDRIASSPGRLQMGNADGTVIGVRTDVVSSLLFVDPKVDTSVLSDIQALFLFGKTQIDTVLRLQGRRVLES